MQFLTNLFSGFLVIGRDDDTSSVILIVAIIAVLVVLVILIIMIAGYWKIFKKAGKPGYAVLISGHNLAVILEIVGRPLWWYFLYLVPICNIVIMIIVSIDLAKSFGKGTGFGIGIVFLPIIFIPILGFGSATYAGPAAATNYPSSNSAS
jgi:hypothetical protein